MRRHGNSGDSGSMRRPPRILLVDDDADSREICAMHLEKAGFEILQAADGSVGVATAVRRRPDVIVMDLHMPVMNGFEALEHLRAHVSTRAVPVILLSANGNEREARHHGCAAFLRKPCDAAELEDVVRSLSKAEPPRSAVG